MNKADIEKLLKDEIKPICQIEEDLGIPKTTLQKALKGKRDLPKKWAIKLKEAYDKSISKEEQEIQQPTKKESATTIPVIEKHPLWKEGDPKENSAGFMIKYGVANYFELEQKITKNGK